MDSVQDHTISRRKKQKAAEKLQRAQFGTEPTPKNAAATIRNTCARRIHQLVRNPGRSGFSAKAAEQLTLYFSKKVPESEKPVLNEMDPTASMMVLQMVSEVTDRYGSLRHGKSGPAIEDSMMASGQGSGAGQEGEGSLRAGAEGVVEEDAMEALGKEELGEEDSERGGVVLAKDW